MILFNWWILQRSQDNSWRKGIWEKAFHLVKYQITRNGKNRGQTCVWTSQSANSTGREGDTSVEVQPGPLRDGNAGRDRDAGRDRKCGNGSLLTASPERRAQAEDGQAVGLQPGTVVSLLPGSSMGHEFKARRIPPSCIWQHTGNKKKGKISHSVFASSHSWQENQNLREMSQKLILREIFKTRYLMTQRTDKHLYP